MSLGPRSRIGERNKSGAAPAIPFVKVRGRGGGGEEEKAEVEGEGWSEGRKTEEERDEER